MLVRHVNADRGSTLVEVMIASAVLAISLVATLGAMATSGAATSVAQEEALALQLASERMNSLRSISYQETEAMLGDSTFEPGAVPGQVDGHGHAYAYGHLKGKGGVLPTGQQRVTSDSGTLVVEVTVTWSSSALGQEMSRSLFWRAAP